MRRRPCARAAALPALLALLLAALLAGCWDRTQLEDLAYVVRLGIDQAPGGKVMVTAQLARTSFLGTGVLGGGTSATDATPTCHTITMVSGTINQAIARMNAAYTRDLTMKHLRGVLFGEALAQGGMEPQLMELWRLADVRGTAQVVQVRGGTAREILKECRPFSEVNIARVPEGMVLQGKRYHMAPPVRLLHFLSHLSAPGGDPFMTAVAMNPGRLGSPEDLTESTGEALAGDVPRLGGNPAEYMGTAVYRKARLVGYLNADETVMLLALRGEMGKAYLSVPDPDHPGQVVALRFQQENKPQYRAFFQGGKPTVQVRLLLEGELMAAPGGTDFVPAQNRERLEQAVGKTAEEMAAQLMTKLRQWETDPVGFGLLFRGRFANWKEWEAYDWPSRVKDLDVTVTARMRVRRYGLYTGPDRIRGGGE
jgi:spore germination protein KC